MCDVIGICYFRSTLGRCTALMFFRVKVRVRIRVRVRVLGNSDHKNSYDVTHRIPSLACSEPGCAGKHCHL